MSNSIFAKSQILLENTFKIGWAAVVTNPLVPVAYENVPFRQPTTEFVRFTVRRGKGSQVSLGAPGSKAERQFGIVIVSIFTPKNTGNTRANVLADAAASIFRYQQLTDQASGLVVNMRAPETQSPPTSTDFYQVNCNIPFEANGYF